MKAIKILTVISCFIWITACTVSNADTIPVEGTLRPSSAAVTILPASTETMTPVPSVQPTRGTPFIRTVIPTATFTPTPTSSPTPTPTAEPTSTPVALPTNCAADTIKCDEIHFSPDGRYLAYKETKLDEPSGCGLANTLYVLDARTLEPLFAQLNARFSEWLTPDKIEIIDVIPVGCDGDFHLQVVDLLTGEKQDLLWPWGHRGWTSDKTAYYQLDETGFWIYDIQTGVISVPPFEDSTGWSRSDSSHTLCWNANDDQLIFTRDQVELSSNRNAVLDVYWTIGQREIWRFDRETTTFTQILANPEHSYYLTNLQLTSAPITFPLRSPSVAYQHGFECQWSGDWIQVRDVSGAPKVSFMSETFDPVQLMGTAEEQKCGLFGLDCENNTLLALNINTGETKPWADLNLNP